VADVSHQTVPSIFGGYDLSPWDIRLGVRNHRQVGRVVLADERAQEEALSRYHAGNLEGGADHGKRPWMGACRMSATGSVPACLPSWLGIPKADRLHTAKNRLPHSTVLPTASEAIEGR
jgi:hypothetical protein